MRAKLTKIGAAVLMLAILMGMIPMGTSAYTEGYYSYSVKDSVATITRYSGYELNVVIPSELGGYPVASIGERSFYNNNSLESIIIPDSVTSIGESAFSSCYSIESIAIPESVTSIGNGAFAWCKSLKSIIIPDSVTSIGESAFNNCSSLKSIIIPDGVVSIGESAFHNCSSLKSIIIPDSVTSIGKGAFAWCESLESIIIPDGVTHIIESTFSYCKNLKNVTIPDSVISIGYMAFSSCTGLKNITIPESVTSISSSAFSNCPGLTIHCYKDSYAYSYAVEKSILFTIIRTGDPTVDSQINVGSARGKAGETVDVTVSIDKNPGVVAMMLKLNYDTDILKLVGVSNADSVFSDPMHGGNLNLLPYNMSWIMLLGEGNNNTNNGLLVTLKFEILTGRESCETPIIISYEPSDIINANYEQIPFMVQNGSVTVSPTKRVGDVNGDEEITVTDALLLRQYIVGGYNITSNNINMLNADTTNDGVINIVDILILRQYIVGDFNIELSDDGLSLIKR